MARELTLAVGDGPGERPPALDLSGLSVTFPGQRALDNVSLTIPAGAVRGLIGANGSGKSTLIKVLTGYHRPDDTDSVCCTVAGTELRLGAGRAGGTPQAAIRVVHQDLGLVDGMTVIENIEIGVPAAPGARSLGVYARRRATRRRAALLDEFGLAGRAADKVGELDPGERVLVAVVRALAPATEPAVLLLDEPSANCGPQTTAAVIRIVERLKDRGVGILYVSHHLTEVLELSDVISVLRDGRIVGEWQRGAATVPQLVQSMLGEEHGVSGLASDLALRSPAVATKVSAGPAAVATDVDTTTVRLLVSGLSGEICDDLEFTAAAGEILGITGLQGSGVHELAPLLFGAVPRRGTVTVDGRSAKADPGSSIIAGLAYLPGDRTRLSGVQQMTARDNITFTTLERSRRYGWLSNRAQRAQARNGMRSEQVRPAQPELALARFSGGNQQKLLLRKWVEAGPVVMLLEEPTQGVDIRGSEAIAERLARLADDGVTVVLVSTNENELALLCGRVLVLRHGRFARELRGTEITPRAVLEAMNDAGNVTGSPSHPTGPGPEISKGASHA